MLHVFDRKRECCVACNGARIDVEDGRLPPECFGAIEYREYLIGTTWVKEPVYSSNHPQGATQ